MIDDVELVIDKYVRPKLSEHQGNVQVIGYKNNILKIKLTGQCSNCSSARYTVENIIEEELRKHIPDINQVILTEGVSEELLSFAKKILNKQ